MQVYKIVCSKIRVEGDTEQPLFHVMKYIDRSGRKGYLRIRLVDKKFAESIYQKNPTIGGEFNIHRVL